MMEEILELGRMDPEVLEAEKAARKLLWEFKNSTDPLTKKAVKTSVYDALEYRVKLRVKSQARQAADTLRDLRILHASGN